MKKILDKKIINHYISLHNFKEYFDHDFTEYLELLSFKEGEYLIYDGSTSKYLLFMVEGKCRYTSVNDAGTNIIFGASETFKIFGEAASLWNELPSNSVQAIEDTYCLAINLHKYRNLLLSDNKFLLFICKTLSHRLRAANITYAYYRSTNTENRLASFLVQNSHNGVFSTSLVDTADMLGVSYRHLLRVIADFVNEGIIKKDKRKYYILNHDKLNELIQYNFVYFD